MKIKIVFNPQALQNIKSILQSVYKLLLTQNQLPKVHFVYFIKLKQIRILIDSQKNPIVISLSKQMINHSETSFHLKQGKQMVCIVFEESKIFFQNFLGILQMEDNSGLVFQVRKQLLDNVQRKFVKLTLRDNSIFLSRILTDTPKYDVHNIKYHKWICGCIEQSQLIQLVIYTDELFCMMRYLTKLKQSVDNKQLIKLDIEKCMYTSRSSDEHCLPNVQGQFKIGNCKKPTPQQITYEIDLGDIKTVFEMIKKVKQLKVIISRSLNFIITFMKEDLYLCHVDMSDWIKLRQKQMGETIAQTKIEENESDGMKPY